MVAAYEYACMRHYHSHCTPAHTYKLLLCMGPCKCAPKLPDSCWMTCEAKNETLGNLPDTQPLQAIWQLSFMHFYCPNSTKTVINQQFHKFCLICSFGVLGPFLPTFAMRIYCGKKHENNNTTCSLLFCAVWKKAALWKIKIVRQTHLIPLAASPKETKTKNPSIRNTSAYY